MSVFYDYIKEFLLINGMMSRMAIFGAALGTFLLLIFVVSIVFFIVRIVFVKVVGRIVLKTH